MILVFLLLIVVGWVGFFAGMGVVDDSTFSRVYTNLLAVTSGGTLGVLIVKGIVSLL